MTMLALEALSKMTGDEEEPGMVSSSSSSKRSLVHSGQRGGAPHKGKVNDGGRGAAGCADHDSILKPREKGAAARIAPHPLHTRPRAPLFLLFFLSPVLPVNQWQQEEEQSFVSVLTPTFFSPF